MKTLAKSLSGEYKVCNTRTLGPSLAVLVHRRRPLKRQEKDVHDLQKGLLGELLVDNHELDSLPLEQPLDELESQLADPVAMRNAYLVKRSFQNRAEAFFA
ncbi:MAG: hypothetical protein AAF328_08370 [Planctomycetota bacterium]